MCHSDVGFPHLNRLWSCPQMSLLTGVELRCSPAVCPLLPMVWNLHPPTRRRLDVPTGGVREGQDLSGSDTESINGVSDAEGEDIREPVAPTEPVGVDFRGRPPLDEVCTRCHHTMLVWTTISRIVMVVSGE